MNLTKVKAIIWDWNGTLLNDVDICINCMNQLLTGRGLQTISKQKYLDIFTFPVKDYYEKAGFDFNKEKFEIPALQFIELYHQKLKYASLHPEVVNILNYAKTKGIQQYVLSAMQHDSLIKSLKDNDIYDYFMNINGIDNHYAHSKVEMGFDLIEKIPYKREEIVLIGDTLHDESVARELGVECILIASGHQSKKRLDINGTRVLNRLEELKKLF